MKSRLVILAAVLVVVGLSACVTSGYQQFYKPYRSDSELKEIEMLGKDESPAIFSSTDFQRDGDILVSKGYIALGISGFNGPMASETEVVAQARRVGATMVLINANYTGTVTSTVPLFLPDSSTTTNAGSISGRGGSATYSGTSTTSGTKVVNLTRETQRYDQAALYFAKFTRKHKYGLLLADLTPELRVREERNTGVLIKIVFEDTPAFMANILPGDILIEVDGIPVRNVMHAMERLSSTPTDSKTTFKIIRNGREKEIQVLLDQR